MVVVTWTVDTLGHECEPLSSSRVYEGLRRGYVCVLGFRPWPNTHYGTEADPAYEEDRSRIAICSVTGTAHPSLSEMPEGK